MGNLIWSDWGRLVALTADIALVYQTADATVIYCGGDSGIHRGLTKGEIVGEKAVDNSRV
ncbi:hypothetical protein H4Q26_000546 [Puccinia striiformis f. sp. tritici PST-130]|nr:hypothetical protein H4Q26_000546 [Puccinia striiformis f. sp. tritici PST-130]